MSLKLKLKSKIKSIVDLKNLRNIFTFTSNIHKNINFQHFNSIKFIRMKIDVLNKIINDILCQSNNENH